MDIGALWRWAFPLRFFAAIVNMGILKFAKGIEKLYGYQKLKEEIDNEISNGDDGSMRCTGRSFG